MSLSKYSKKVWIPDVGSKPHQPLVNFKFPYREFGKQKLVKRAFQHSWFAKWKWLHYEEDRIKPSVTTVFRRIKKTSCEHQEGC